MKPWFNALKLPKMRVAGLLGCSRFLIRRPLLKVPSLLIQLVVVGFTFTVLSGEHDRSQNGGTITNASLLSVIRTIDDRHPAYIQWSDRGSVISLTVPPHYCDDATLSILPELHALQELFLFGGDPAHIVTSNGVSALTTLTNLSRLQLACFWDLRAGVISEVSRFKSLRRLMLLAADAPAEEYGCLTNLTQLEAVRITYAPRFGDRQLAYLTNLTHLGSVQLYKTAVTDSWRSILQQAPSLRSIEIGPSGKDSLRRGDEK
jgi:hypothetical protein